MGIKEHTYKVHWSEKDQDYVGTYSDFPSLSWLAATEEEALIGIYRLVQDLMEHVKMTIKPTKTVGRKMEQGDVYRDDFGELVMFSSIPGRKLSKVIYLTGPSVGFYADWSEVNGLLHAKFLFNIEERYGNQNNSKSR